MELKRGERNFAPIARELDGGIETAWWDIRGEPGKLDGIKSPWTDDKLAAWQTENDWHNLGGSARNRNQRQSRDHVDLICYFERDKFEHNMTIGNPSIP